MQRASRISSYAGWLAPPAPLFAAAILPGAATAVCTASPSSFSPGPGLSAGRRGPSVPVCLHVATACCPRAPLLGSPNNPRKEPIEIWRQKKRKALQERLDRRGRVGGAFGGRDLVLVFASLRRLWSRGRNREEAGKLPLFGAVQPEPRTSAVGRGEVCSPLSHRSPPAFLPSASRSACGGSLDCGSVSERPCFWGFIGMRTSPSAAWRFPHWQRCLVAR